MQSLTSGPHTFTPDRVRQILREDLDHDSHQAKGYFHCKRTAFEHLPSGKLIAFDVPQRKARAAEWVGAYCSAVAHPKDHLSRLDRKFSELLKHNLNLENPEYEDELISHTCHTLSRLPELPPEFDGLPQEIFGSLNEHYFASEMIHSDDRAWNNLQVVSFVSTNVIRLALTIELIDPTNYVAGALSPFVDTISELLQSLYEDGSEHAEHLQERFLVTAFLWSAWQRSVMLFFYYTLGGQMRRGYRSDTNEDQRLQPTPYSPRQYDLGRSGYLCRWAYELLRTDPAAAGADLRRFHERYESLYADRLPRCRTTDTGVYVPCDGKAPENCGRFKGMHIEDQSTHVPSCLKSCPRLYWDEASFKNVTGARAVSVNEEPTGCRLKYVAASSQTMAISHVWSHGQGGRPEEGTTGFNACLHNRYCSIARSIGCDSYWMDTPCIPGLHKNLDLRREAIDKINQVFSESKITLISDRDIMDIDVSSITLGLQESILAAFLVCDWNVRAWTLLEATRGTGNLYLLFKDDRILSFNQILETVYTEGNMDIAILFSDAPHLLPLRPNNYENLEYSDYIEADRAAYLLSHRYATREGDEIVIWSLLCNEKASHSAEEFWRTRVGHTLTTGFLMSSVPRMKDCPGLTWAPLRPDLQETSRRSQGSFLLPSPSFNAFDGQGSELGFIRKDGFSARWLVHVIQRPPSTPISRTVYRIRDRVTPRSRKSRPISQVGTIANIYLREDQMGALLQPKTLFRDHAFGYRGKANGTLLAVVGSNNGGSSWRWKGIYEWNEKEPLPRFEVDPIQLA